MGVHVVRCYPVHRALLIESFTALHTLFVCCRRVPPVHEEARNRMWCMLHRTNGCEQGLRSDQHMSAKAERTRAQNSNIFACGLAILIESGHSRSRQRTIPLPEKRSFYESFASIFLALRRPRLQNMVKSYIYGIFPIQQTSQRPTSRLARSIMPMPSQFEV